MVEQNINYLIYKFILHVDVHVYIYINDFYNNIRGIGLRIVCLLIHVYNSVLLGSTVNSIRESLLCVNMTYIHVYN